MFTAFVIGYILFISCGALAQTQPTECLNSDFTNFTSSQLEVLVDQVLKCSEKNNVYKSQVSSFTSVISQKLHFDFGLVELQTLFGILRLG